jgi:hypothetical protein
VHLAPIVHSVRVSLLGQTALGGDDPTVDAVAAQLVDAIGPALRHAALDLAEQAAIEIAAQLPDRTVDVVLVDGDPSLRVRDVPTDPGSGTARDDEEFDARITLRLPPSLKRLVEESATVGGESVNAWVVEALSRGTRRAASARGQRITEQFDL